MFDKEAGEPVWLTGASSNFNAHHSPMGAFTTFTCGHAGTRGGLRAQHAPASPQDLFVGIKRGQRTSDAPLRCLPLFDPSRAADLGANVVELDSRDVRRRYGWATDRWATDEFEFAVHSPFGGIVDPSESHASMSRVCLMPAILATLTIDNSTGEETKTGVFAIKFNSALPNSGGVNVLPEQHGWRGKQRVGFSVDRAVGFQGMLDTDPSDRSATLCPFLRNDVIEGLHETPAIHRLGDCAGIAFEVPPGRRRTLLIAMGSYFDGVVTSGVEGKYLYTKYFSGLLDVLDHALRAYDAIRSGSEELDKQLLASGLSGDQQFLIAHATRTYYANTQLLDVAGEPMWIVNGGESRLMNQLDVAVDHAFWELEQNPWTVRNVLDAYAKRYSYYDHVKVPVEREETRSTGAQSRRNESGTSSTAAVAPPPATDEQSTSHIEFEHAPGGISFCRDMGAANVFAPPGTSASELPDRDGPFAFTTQEQLCNWILIAASYVARTGDAKWLGDQRDRILSCFRSMQNRELNAGGVPGGTTTDESMLDTGALEFDSDRCGTSGSETTTYDTLDRSLAQARDGLYVATKRIAAYLGLEFLLARLGETGGEEAAGAAARRAATAVCSQLSDENGFIPANFDPDDPAHAARILPAVEALVFPWYWGTCDHGGDYKSSHGWLGVGKESLIACLKRHTLTLLSDRQRRNIFPDDGLRLSSASDASWISKLAIFQHVARRVLRIDDDPVLKEHSRAADAAHVKWQVEGAAEWGCSDGFVKGVARSRLAHPGCITTALWMDRNV